MKNASIRVSTALPPSDLSAADQQQRLELRAGDRESLGRPMREIQVTGVAEVSCPADRASVRISVSSMKVSVNDVTESVTRRLDYILQALRQQFVQEKNTSVRKFLHREADMYTMDAEVVVTFLCFESMERICSTLLEKLDKNVHVGAPRFYHSPECLSETRKRACVAAVENAQQKAIGISLLLRQHLESPLLIREEETKEWRSEEEEGGREQSSPPHFPHLPTVTVSSRVSVSFNFRS